MAGGRLASTIGRLAVLLRNGPHQSQRLDQLNDVTGKGLSLLGVYGLTNAARRELGDIRIGQAVLASTGYQIIEVLATRRKPRRQLQCDEGLGLHLSAA